MTNKWDPDLLTPAPIRHGWQDDALCTEIGFHAYFVPSGEYPKAALRACGSCPVARDCLETAMNMEQGHMGDLRTGLWGGLKAKERRQLERARRAEKQRAA